MPPGHRRTHFWADALLAAVLVGGVSSALALLIWLAPWHVLRWALGAVCLGLGWDGAFLLLRLRHIGKEEP